MERGFGTCNIPPEPGRLASPPTTRRSFLTRSKRFYATLPRRCTAGQTPRNQIANPGTRDRPGDTGSSGSDADATLYPNCEPRVVEADPGRPREGRTVHAPQRPNNLPHVHRENLMPTNRGYLTNPGRLGVRIGQNSAVRRQARRHVSLGFQVQLRAIVQL